MEFSPTDEQMSLRDSVGRFVADSHDFNRARAISASEEGFCREHWSTFAELGWLSLMVPQDHGGIGASTEDAAIVMEEFGKGLVAAPFLSTAVLGVELISESAQFASKTSLLESIAAGRAIVALACEETQSRYELAAVSTGAQWDGDAYVMTGRKIAVLDGGFADAFIVSAHLSSGQSHAGCVVISGVGRHSRPRDSKISDDRRPPRSQSRDEWHSADRFGVDGGGRTPRCKSSFAPSIGHACYWRRRRWGRWAPRWN